MIARRDRRPAMRPRDWGLGLAATAALITAIVVVVGVVVVGLLYVVIAFVGSFFSHAAVPW
jgi:hypothetical protein